MIKEKLSKEGTRECAVQSRIKIHYHSENEMKVTFELSNTAFPLRKKSSAARVALLVPNE